jgi:hypothetical protein
MPGASRQVKIISLAMTLWNTDGLETPMILTKPAPFVIFHN